MRPQRRQAGHRQHDALGRRRRRRHRPARRAPSRARAATLEITGWLTIERPARPRRRPSSSSRTMAGSGTAKPERAPEPEASDDAHVQERAVVLEVALERPGLEDPVMRLAKPPGGSRPRACGRSHPICASQAPAVDGDLLRQAAGLVELDGLLVELEVGAGAGDEVPRGPEQRHDAHHEQQQPAASRGSGPVARRATRLGTTRQASVSGGPGRRGRVAGPGPRQVGSSESTW